MACQVVRSPSTSHVAGDGDRRFAISCWLLAVGCSVGFVLLLCSLSAKVRRQEVAADAPKGAVAGTCGQRWLDDVGAACCGACTLFSMVRRSLALVGLRRAQRAATKN